MLLLHEANTNGGAKGTSCKYPQNHIYYTGDYTRLIYKSVQLSALDILSGATGPASGVLGEAVSGPSSKICLLLRKLISNVTQGGAGGLKTRQVNNSIMVYIYYSKQLTRGTGRQCRCKGKGTRHYQKIICPYNMTNTGG